MSIEKTGVAVMASMSDFGLTTKDARGVYPEDTALPRPLAAAKDALLRFSRRLGVSMEGAPQDVAQSIAMAMGKDKPAKPVRGATFDGIEP